jgi:hypothetical protein
MPAETRLLFSLCWQVHSIQLPNANSGFLDSLDSHIRYGYQCEALPS